MKKALKNCLYMFSFLNKYCKVYVWMSFLMAILSSFNSVLSICFLQIAMNTATKEENFSRLINITIIQTIVLCIFAALNSIYQSKIVPINQQKFQKKMYSELFQKSSSILVEKYDDTNFYNKFVLALNNSDSRALSILNIFTSLINSVFTIIGIIIVIGSLDSYIFLFVVINVLISICINMMLSKLSYQLNIRITSVQRGISYVRRIYYLKEYANELRMTNISKSIDLLYQELNAKALKFLEESGTEKVRFYFLQSISQIFYTSGLMLYLAFRLLARTIAVGDFVALMSSSNRLSSSLKNLLRMVPNLYEHSLYIDNFKEFVEFKTTYKYGNQELIHFEELSILNVSFGYNSGKNVIENLNLNIRKGEKIALVGTNGAGKSTILKLIVGLYQPCSGTITFNKISLHSYSRESFLEKVGIIFQDFNIYSISIIDNILMRPIEDKVLDEHRVIEALKKVNLYEKVRDLPQGIYTTLTRELDPNGVIFSRGELQKIIVARILASNYELIILDEPSSSFDAISESELFKVILSAYYDKTVIIVSHNLVNLTMLDRIYYIHNGSIAETGTHEELLNMGGLYSKLYNAKV